VVLCLLYSKRRPIRITAALSLLDMENIMAFPRERLLFAFGICARSVFVVQDDRSSFIIAAEGVDFLESSYPPTKFFTRFPRHRSGRDGLSKALTIETSYGR